MEKPKSWPERDVIEIVRGKSDEWPYHEFSYAVLECGHTAKTSAGERFPCERCQWEIDGVAAIIALSKTDEWSHLTERDMSASKTGEWMSYCAYRREPRAPTQCTLAKSVAVSAYTTKALREAGLVAIPGPSRGSLASL